MWKPQLQSDSTTAWLLCFSLDREMWNKGHGRHMKGRGGGVLAKPGLIASAGRAFVPLNSRLFRHSCHAAADRTVLRWLVRPHFDPALESLRHLRWIPRIIHLGTSNNVNSCISLLTMMSEAAQEGAVHLEGTDHSGTSNDVNCMARFVAWTEKVDGKLCAEFIGLGSCLWLTDEQKCL
jgi:hypothetical protein